MPVMGTKLVRKSLNSPEETRPFEGGTQSSVMAKHLEEARPTPPIRENEAAASLLVVLSRMMALRPEERYPSARAVIEDLDRWLEKWPPPPSKRGPH